MKISKTFIFLTLTITTLVAGSYYMVTKARNRPEPQKAAAPANNLSYLVLTTDDQLHPVVTSPSGDHTGTKDGQTLLTNIAGSSFSQETSLYDSENPGSEEGVPYWNLEIKHPESGDYTLEFIAPKAGDYIFELYAYNQTGKMQVEKQSITLKANTPTNYTIKYSQTGEYPTTLLHLN
jgi:hypothetical protein